MQWVRINRQGGAYNQDVGLVEAVDQGKVWVRLIPRIEMPSMLQTKAGKFKSRVPQKFNIKANDKNYERCSPIKNSTTKKFYKVRGQYFSRGFVYKKFDFK